MTSPSVVSVECCNIVPQTVGLSANAGIATHYGAENDDAQKILLQRSPGLEVQGARIATCYGTLSAELM